MGAARGQGLLGNVGGPSGGGVAALNAAKGCGLVGRRRGS
jgi:hypothetical protein